jgi:hypothetical protein
MVRGTHPTLVKIQRGALWKAFPNGVWERENAGAIMYLMVIKSMF